MTVIKNPYGPKLGTYQVIFLGFDGRYYRAIVGSNSAKAAIPFAKKVVKSQSYPKFERQYALRPVGLYYAPSPLSEEDAEEFDREYKSYLLTFLSPFDGIVNPNRPTLPGWTNT